ncbi:MAG TPA: filamentous hemagglutinin N-terminal domain-containing protein, partial [Burkholderiales bacterium]|nr:filamentous hemagglutinin N-terminal domain-containing protein [Burkholderiales bacterium]
MRLFRANAVQRNFLLAAITCIAGHFAYANPVGPTVVNGQASFSTQGALLSITNSPGAIINWQQFSIAPNETTRFIQQSAASAVLNRVIGIDPSLILGSLQSNGRVFLINPNGIVFGANSRIDVAGMVASTLNISNADFIAGRLNFVGDPAKAAAVVNQGRITASPGGSVYLLGSAVENQGVITAPTGDIVLAAGKSVRVTEGSTPGVQVEITAPTDSSINLSQLAYGSGGIYAGLVKNSGVINADSAVRGADGSIILKASNDVTLDSSSQISANGQNGGRVVAQAQQGTASVSGNIEAVGKAGQGGSVAIVGQQTGLLDGAQVDASGAAGGGSVLIGGDLHGANILDGSLALANSQRTYVAASASIHADALQSGSGGKVVVWADEATKFYGAIFARGGATNGNGGFVETSGKGWLDYQGFVDVRAPMGASGTLLLDPTNIYIALNQANATTAGMSGTDSTADTGSGGNPNTFLASGAVQDSLLTTGSLNAALGSANVVVTTNNAAGTGAGNITVVDPITWASTNSLTLTAASNISINASVTTGAAGSALILNAGGNVTQTAVIGGPGGLTQSGAGTATLSQANTYTGVTTVSAGTLSFNSIANVSGGSSALGAPTTVANGTIALAGGATLQYTGTGHSSNRVINLTSSGGIVDASGSGTLTLSGGVTGNTNNLTLTGTGAGVESGVIATTTGTLTKNGTGTWTLSGTNTFTGATAINNGTLTLSGANGTATSTTFTVNQGGILSLDNSAANNTNRISDANALTLNGGEFQFSGTNVAATNASETVGQLTLSSGASTVTAFSGTGGSTTLTFASANRSAGATVLFRGTNLGSNPGAGNTNIKFTAAGGLNLTGGGGAAGTTNINIVPYAIGDTSAAGSGIGFVTYNVDTNGNTNGIRPLNLATEYTTSTAAAGVNLLVSASVSPNVTRAFNSILLSGGSTYTIGSGGGNKTLTVASGAIFSAAGAANTITGRAGDRLTFGGTGEGVFSTLGNLSFTTALNATAGNALTKAGSGILKLS